MKLISESLNYLNINEIESILGCLNMIEFIKQIHELFVY